MDRFQRGALQRRSWEVQMLRFVRHAARPHKLKMHNGDSADFTRGHVDLAVMKMKEQQQKVQDLGVEEEHTEFQGGLAERKEKSALIAREALAKRKEEHAKRQRVSLSEALRTKAPSA